MTNYFSSLDFNELVERLEAIGKVPSGLILELKRFEQALDSAWEDLTPQSHAWGMIILFTKIVEVATAPYELRNFELTSTDEGGSQELGLKINSDYWAIPLLVGNFYKTLVETGGPNFITIDLGIVDEDGVQQPFSVTIARSEGVTPADKIAAQTKRIEELEKEIANLQEEKNELDLLLDERNAEINAFLDQQAGASL